MELGRGRPWLSHFQKDTRTTTASALLPLKNQRTPNQLDVTGSKQFVLGSLQIEVVPSVHIYGHQKFTNKTCCRSWFFWWCHWSILRINCKWMRGQNSFFWSGQIFVAYLKNETIYHEIFPLLFNGFASLNLDFSCTLRIKGNLYLGGIGVKVELCKQWI